MTGSGPEQPVVRTRVVVSGRVQGVFFRDACRRQALRHGVAGRVRNCQDGTVEAIFEGPRDAVAAMVAWTAEGPPSAVVDDVRTIDEPPEGLEGFAMR